MTPYDDDQKLKAVKDVLGEPVICEFSDNVLKIRNNLIVSSVISIYIVTAALYVDPDSRFLGLKFGGLTDEAVRNGLFFLTLYLLIHFIWSAFDNFLGWRVRITGTRASFVTTAVLGSEHGDYPKDPRQSTLYTWWLMQAKDIGNIAIVVTQLEEQVQEWEVLLKNEINARANSQIIWSMVQGTMEASGSDDSYDAPQTIAKSYTATSKLHKTIADLCQKIERTQNTISAYRIPVSLKRFDSWFKLLLCSQNLRWLLIEFLLPIILGSWALLLLR
jgi:hypothetical protein